MTDTAANRYARLEANLPLLKDTLRGIEKEGLRVDGQGKLALTPHPARLGSALTNEHVTTDYSESLLELITGTHRDVDALLGELSDTHRHVYSVLGQELIWNQSMPATLPGEADIPIAWYGTSNTGMLKHVYRRGLAERYGKTMQCIAGVHYNYSLADGLWDVLDTAPGTTQDRCSRGYIGLIRNFTRYSWLLMYLFGAAPALARDFLRGHEHPLQSLGDHTLYLPHATSLRMSDLGYQNKAQSQLKLCYNDLDTFLGCLFDAVTQPWPDYQKIGTHRDGQWIQLNTNVLQIENEYYSSIRPSAPPAAASARSPRWPSAACSTWKCAAWTSTLRAGRHPGRDRPLRRCLPAVLRRIRQPLLPRQRLLPAQRRQLLHRRQGRPQARPATGPRRPAREPGAMGQRTAGPHRALRRPV